MFLDSIVLGIKLPIIQNLQTGGSGGGGGGGGIGDETATTDDTLTALVLSIALLVGVTEETGKDSISIVVLNTLVEDITNERPSSSGDCVITVSRNVSSGLKSDGR